MRAVLWQRLDQPGHEAVRLVQGDTGYELAGTAVFADDARPCRLDYAVRCDAEWRTTAARVTGWVGSAPVEVSIIVGAGGRWTLNGRECPAVAGCIDVDLNFSPCTNLLPVRRLRLPVGQAAAVRAAWLRFPSFVLEPLDQVYRRLGTTAFRYESGTGYTADLEIDEDGFAVRYADIWSMVASC